MGERITRFVFVFLLFSTIDRERRAEDHLLLQFYQKTTPPPTRARFRAKEKKGGEEEEEEEEENNGLEEGIRFDLRVFFFFRRRRLSSNRIRLFFPTERKCLVSISFLFFSFEEGGRGEVDFLLFLFWSFLQRVRGDSPKSYICVFFLFCAQTQMQMQMKQGLKKLGVRVSMYAPATIMASTVFGLFPTMGACMEACGLGAPGGPLASLAGPLLFSTAGQVASVSAGVAGMLGIGGDIPAYLHSLIFLVAAASLWQYTTAGAASVLAINAYAFHYAHMATMLSNCAEVTSRVPYWLMGAVKKIALVGPGLVMAMLQLLPRAMEFASFEKIGFAPPGLLGPIGAAFLHPIVPWIIAISSLVWLTGEEKKITSFICGMGYLIPAISYCSTLMAPYGYALMFMHLYLGLQLLQEVTPYSSLIPNPL